MACHPDVRPERGASTPIVHQKFLTGGGGPTTTTTTTTPTSTTTTTTLGGLTTFERRVSANSDDAEQRGTSVDLSSSDLELTEDSSAQTIGIRFQNVTIPPGATIVNAWVQFTVDETTSGATSLTFAGQAADNAGTFTTSSNNLGTTTRPRTAATVPWAPAPGQRSTRHTPRSGRRTWRR